MKIEIKGGIFAELEFDGSTRYVFWGYEQMDGYTKIQPHTITVDIPDDFDPRPGLVAELRKEQKKVMADAQVSFNRIEERISKLLALENRPAKPVVSDEDDGGPF